eukprot:324988-Prorocentrum_lima.AAC.1
MDDSNVFLELHSLSISVAREMAKEVSSLPGHKLMVVGGCAQNWTLNPIFDVYASAARHAM